jgi:hypothetical protein
MNWPRRSKFEAFAVSGDGGSSSLPLPDQRVACEGLRKSAIGQIFFGVKKQKFDREDARLLLRLLRGVAGPHEPND